MARFELKAQRIRRDQLAKIAADPQTIKQLENLTGDVVEALPGNTAEALERAEEAIILVNILKNRSYVVATPELELGNARVLAATGGLIISDDGAGDTITVRTVNLLQDLDALDTEGFVARQDGTAATRVMTAASDRIIITDGDGIEADPTFDVDEEELDISLMKGTLEVEHGGTGGTTPAEARTALELDGLLAITGDFKQRAAAAFPPGWVRSDGGTIGGPSSGATRANADTEDLFTLWWSDFTNAQLPILTSAGLVSTRGASAAADFTAGKRMTVPVIADGSLLIGAYKL